jgi:hypothetical protein
MSIAARNDWQRDFGIVSTGSKTFFSSKAELHAGAAPAAQRHILRRAFDLLKLDGVLCTGNTPLVYFKLLKRIETQQAVDLHRKFWNHGGAPILVLVSPNEVHIYSGLARPVAHQDSRGVIPGLVQMLDRASQDIQEFLPSVESGEFFRIHQKSFNPAQRVDRDLLDNLQATRDKLAGISSEKLDANVLDALLCRLVFACYLFDRGVVKRAYLRGLGLPQASHLRDVLGLKPATKAKKYLYLLFEKLGKDFNGDLFSDDLDAEARLVPATAIGPLDDFFRATDVLSGQASFWPYDFSVIPIEAISAIYERFLRDADKKEGAFYTPRFLAELVLDLALSNSAQLLDQRYMDPSCGSGIFLVGLFNRIAEEWKQQNPKAANDRRATQLRKVLCYSLCGVDTNPTACRITAFSLYLAYLDQLSPRDVQELRRKGHKLPRLVHYPESRGKEIEGNIWCGDFFDENSGYPSDVDLVVGNPPWGSTAEKGSPASAWCSSPDHRGTIPDLQIAAAFVWKAVRHVTVNGRVCFVLPHGLLFNRSQPAVQFQRELFARHSVDQVLNLADYQRFLFEEAGHPALVITYRQVPPESPRKTIEYLTPKADWLVTRAEIIAVAPEDRAVIDTKQVLDDLDGPDAPQIWKKWYWATGRDRRLIDRLAMYPRLRDHVRQTKEVAPQKPWIMAVGVQPVGTSDDPSKAETIPLPSKLFIEATSRQVDLFLLESDCTKLSAPEFTVRSGSNKATQVFHAPHVLVKEGFANAAFADFDVSFLFSIRGISGPQEDRDQLIFLAAYLRSSLAKYFLFHTSSSWGISRQRVGVDEVLRLPFPLPVAHADRKRAQQIIVEVSRIVSYAAEEASKNFIARDAAIRTATESIEALLYEYFDILPQEEVLVADTVGILIPSARPTRARLLVPTIKPSDQPQRDEYATLLCKNLNAWAKNGPFRVHGRCIASGKLGIGVAILNKAPDGTNSIQPDDNGDLLKALDRLRKVVSRNLNTFELIRGTKIFDGDTLYIVKPIGQRFWTQSAALNDADEIAGTLLMHSPKRVAWQ